MLNSDSTELNSRLHECLQALDSLEKSYGSHASFLDHFNRVLHCLPIVLTQVNKHGMLSHDQLFKEKILLCLSQMSKTLALFSSLTHQPPCRQSVWYLCERMHWCLTELMRIFSSTVCEQDGVSDGCDSFLHHMDEALNQIRTLTPGIPQSFKRLIDEVIYQAVSVAKIANVLDYKEITSASKKMLEETDQLMNENNPNQLSLLKDCIAITLCNLEQRVNKAVLRLFLQVFSEPNKPLKHIVKLCGQEARVCDMEEFNLLVSELDSHMERITLVGQFAVSCCQDINSVRGIRCCLASLESVDNYLVPSLSAFYTSPQSQDIREFLYFLCGHWQDQLSCIQSYLDGILDSRAFSQVVSESVSEMYDELKGGENTKIVGHKIVKQGWLFYKHLSRSPDMSVSPEYLFNLKQEVHECEALQQAPLPALIKQVNQLSTVLDNICDYLAAAPSTPSSSHTHSRDDSIASGFSGDNIFRSIKDLPLDLSCTSESRSHQYNSYRPLSTVTKKSVLLPETSMLSNTMTPKKAGNEISSNAFKTPKNLVKGDMDLLAPFLSQKMERNKTLYKRTPRKVIQSRLLDESMSMDSSQAPGVGCDTLTLEISDILDNLSLLANTLTSLRGAESPQVQPIPAIHMGVAGGEYVSVSSLSSVRTEEVSDVNTPQRLQDLRDLDDRLFSLKLL